ncbi:lysostaphin resistance A-like protein [Candidatus Riflebacteria bacterium]
MSPNKIICCQGLLVFFLFLISAAWNYFSGLQIPLYWPPDPLDLVIATNFGIFLSIIFLIMLRLDSRVFKSVVNLLSDPETTGGMDELLHDLFKDFAFWQIVVLSILAGVGEEYFFRGPCQAVLGLIPTAILFGLVHFLNFTYFITATFAGLYLGYLMDYFDNLAIPMLAHTITDLVGLVYLVYFFEEKNDYEEIEDLEEIPLQLEDEL